MAINIAIDGTAGSGKGTLAKRLANNLGYGCLDTGAIYRSVAYYFIQNKIDLENLKTISNALKNMNFKIEFATDENGNKVQKNILNGEDLGQKIRTEEISKFSSIVSQIKEVRQFATEIQHKIADNFNVVVEGRDIGTVVLPNSKYKFFITASVHVRAERRLKQLNLPQSKFNEVYQEIVDRDFRDKRRKLSPLKVAEDAIYIDNSNQTPEETLSLMMSYIK